MNVKIGCDPEGFLKAGNDFVSAFGIIPGTKHKPFKVNKGAVQVDGVAVEFNIDPAETQDEFNNNISVVVSQIDEMIKKIDKSLTVEWTPVAKFRMDIWQKVDENSKVLGCDPDYNVSGMVNVNPSDALANAPIRTAAGHIHIGFTEVDDPMEAGHFSDCVYIAQGFHTGQLDTYIPKTQEDFERLKYYGHSGSFRPKKYGIELRSPSNWYVNSEEGRRQIYSETRKKFQQLTGL